MSGFPITLLRLLEIKELNPDGTRGCTTPGETQTLLSKAALRPPLTAESFRNEDKQEDNSEDGAQLPAPVQKQIPQPAAPELQTFWDTGHFHLKNHLALVKCKSRSLLQMRWLRNSAPNLDARLATDSSLVSWAFLLRLLRAQIIKSQRPGKT